MARTMRIMRVGLAATVAIFLAAGCEFTTEENLGTVSLAELQGQDTSPDPAPQPSTPAPAPAPSAPISGGSGIGPVGQGGGFLWKPAGEHSGKLVVILPPQYTGQANSVYLNGIGESGAYAGVANGGRTHWRFSKPGGSYGKNIVVVARLKAGGAVHWTVPNGATRTSY